MWFDGGEFGGGDFFVGIECCYCAVVVGWHYDCQWCAFDVMVGEVHVIVFEQFEQHVVDHVLVDRRHECVGEFEVGCVDGCDCVVVGGVQQVVGELLLFWLWDFFKAGECEIEERGFRAGDVHIHDVNVFCREGSRVW